MNQLNIIVHKWINNNKFKNFLNNDMNNNKSIPED